MTRLACLIVLTCASVAQGNWKATPIAGASFGLLFAWDGDHGEHPSKRVSRLRAAAREGEAGNFGQQLRQAWTDSRGLLVLQGLQGMAPKDLVDLASLLGPVEQSSSDGAFDIALDDEPRVHEFSKVPSARVYDASAIAESGTQTCKMVLPDPSSYQFDLATGRPSWHTDQSFRHPAPAGSAMLCLSTPLDGSGGTLFADMTSAYAALNASMKELVDTSEATHAYETLHHNFMKRTKANNTLLSAERLASFPPLKKPLSPAHRHSGKRALYLNPEAIRDVTGFGPDGAREFIGELAAHSTKPSFVYRHNWRTGDVAIWDNRCTMHAPTAVPDAVAHERVMWRVTISA